MVKGFATIGKKHAQSQSDAMVLRGEKDLKRALKAMETKVAAKIALQGTRKQVQALAKQMKQDIPSRFKLARKGIGWKATKGRAASKRNGFQAAIAKAGVGIGLKRAKRKALQESQKAGRAGRSGLGIGPGTFQFWVKTSKPRRTEGGKYTGVMRGRLPGFAGKSARKAAGKVHLAGLREYRKRLTAEAAKLKK